MIELRWYITDLEKPLAELQYRECSGSMVPEWQSVKDVYAPGVAQKPPPAAKKKRKPPTK